MWNGDEGSAARNDIDMFKMEIENVKSHIPKDTSVLTTTCFEICHQLLTPISPRHQQ